MMGILNTRCTNAEYCDYAHAYSSYYAMQTTTVTVGMGIVAGYPGDIDDTSIYQFITAVTCTITDSTYYMIIR